MFSGIPQKNRAAAEVYFDEHLTHNDYYSQSEIKPGIWIGGGLAKLGLKEGGMVNRQQFISLCDNMNPVNEKLLTQRRNEDGKRRVFFDFTCSAPKSVSIMAITMKDTRIVEAHEAAAKIAMKELEQFAGTRIRRDGADNDRTTGNLVGAAFTHNSSRSFLLAQERECRIVLCGDTGQHSSVTRGDALRILEQHSRYAFGELTQLRRQRQADYLQVVELAANKQPEKAFLRLEQMGCVTEQTHGAIYESAARAYVDSIQKGKSALLVSPTWKEIEAVTEKVRDTLKAKGIVSHDDSTVSVLDSLSWTDAQKRDAEQYEMGQRIVFHQKAGAFAKNETIEVVAVGKSSLRVKCADGAERSLNVSQVAGSMDVCQPRQLSIAAGDKLLLQTNRKTTAGKNFINGELVTVKAINGSNILLEDGRTVPTDYRRFTHGYAVTSHSSQGTTVDDVFLVASSRSFGAVNREQFYVSISRGREHCRVFTDDSELLRHRICNTHERTAAIELLDFREALRLKGFSPRISTMRGAVTPSPDSQSNRRVIRLLRKLRAGRDSKILVVQRLYQMAEDLLNRIRQKNQPQEVLEGRIEQRHDVHDEIRKDLLERVRQIKQSREDLRQRNTERPETNEDVRERIRQNRLKDLRERIKQQTSQRQRQSQSRGISM